MAVIREDHLKQVERWAKFVKENPKKWKRAHTEFINSIFAKHHEFKEKLLETPMGRRKLDELFKRKF